MWWDREGGERGERGWGETNPMVILAYMRQGVGFGALRAIMCERRVRERGEVSRSVGGFRASLGLDK